MKSNHALPYAGEIATLGSKPVVIKGSRIKAIVLLAACLGFTLLGAVAIVKGEDDILAMGKPAALIFGIGALLAIIQISRPPVMTLTIEGVGVQTIFKRWFLRWDQVEDFFVYRPPSIKNSTGAMMAAGEMAAFNWTAPVAAEKRGVFSGKKGADGGFGPGWSLSAADLVSVLRAAKARASEDGAKPPAVAPVITAVR
jgi:hypothetical protein